MRKWIFSKVKAILVASGRVEFVDLANRVLSASSYGANGSEAPPRPFIMIRSGLRLPEDLGAESRNLGRGRWPYTIWAHDEPGSYVLIDDVLKEIRFGLSKILFPVMEPNFTLADCRWENDSDDLYDDGFRTAVRNSSYQLVGKELES